MYTQYAKIIIIVFKLRVPASICRDFLCYPQIQILCKRKKILQLLNAQTINPKTFTLSNTSAIVDEPISHT